MTSEVYDVVTAVLKVDGKLRGDEFDFCCPVHGDHKPSAGINLQTGLWHCFTCGAGGDLVGLAMVVRGLDRSSAKQLVRPNTPEALVGLLQRQAYGALSTLRRPTPLELPGPYDDGPFDYLKDRGFSDATIQQYEAQYVKEERFERNGRSFRVRDYIALPIRDRTGRLLAYVYRAARGQAPRYLYTPGASLTTVWFGAHLHRTPDRIVVTEGALDSMWVTQAGVPAVAMLGASMLGTKAGQLRAKYRHVVMFLDRDRAGVVALRRLGEQLRDRLDLRVARYPRRSKAKDPADLTPEQVQRAVERAIPYSRWTTA